jgi:hypothetical protein
LVEILKPLLDAKFSVDFCRKKEGQNVRKETVVDVESGRAKC